MTFEWFRKQREKYPSSSAMFVLPKYSGSPQYPSNAQLKAWDMELVHVYPKGSHLFSSPAGISVPTEWDTLMIWAPPKTDTLPFEPQTYVTKDFLSSLLKAQKSDEFLSQLRRQLESTEYQNDNEFKLMHDYVWRIAEGRYQLCIPPSDPKLKQVALEQSHDVPTAGHLGVFKTQQKLARHFYWPDMQKDAKEYCASCEVCLQSKHTNLSSPASAPILQPTKRWQVVTMDFVTGLPRTARGVDAIVTFTDKMTKMVHFVPLSFKNSSSMTIARLFFDNVVRLHGMPMKIICDRDPRLVSPLYKELMKLLGIKVASTTAYRPQSDGQSENTNRTMESILRSFVEPRQRDWDMYLSAAEFAVNDSTHSVTKLTPFQMMYGEHVTNNLDLLTRVCKADAPPIMQKSLDLVETVAEVVQTAKLRIAQHYADINSRREASSHRTVQPFKVGEKVMLSTKHYTAPTDEDTAWKLRPRYYGPFVITKALYSDNEQLKPEAERIPSAYKLKLPDAWQIHDTFSRDKLKRAPVSSEFPSRFRPEPPPTQEVDGEEEFVVEKILDHRICKSRGSKKAEKHWLIKWLHYPNEENTWLPERMINTGGMQNSLWLDYEAKQDALRNRRAIMSTIRDGTFTDRLNKLSASYSVKQYNQRRTVSLFKVITLTATTTTGLPTYSISKLSKRSRPTYNHLLLNIPSNSLEARSIKQPNPHHDNNIVSVGDEGNLEYDYPVTLHDWIDDAHDTNYLQFAPTYFQFVWANVASENDLKTVNTIISKLKPKHHVCISSLELPDLLANPCMHHIIVYHGRKRHLFTDLPVSNRLERDCNAASTMTEVVAHLTRFCGSCKTLQVNHDDHRDDVA